MSIVTRCFLPTKVKTAMKFKSIITIEVIIFLIGLVLVLVGLLFEINKIGTIWGLERATVQNVLISVGCSIIASSIISYLMTIYLNADKEARWVIETWGLKNIEIRSILNYEINEKLDHMSHGMDIVAFGMKNFLAAKGILLEKKVKQGCTIRILTMHPGSEFLARRDMEEGNSPGQIKKEIEDMIQWAQGINNVQSRKGSGSIEIRGYNGLPQDMYQRIDDHVYVGPLHFGKPSQQTIAYEYKPGSKGTAHYTEYFLSLWKNNSFSEKIL
jgi:hypothetical protein